MLAQGQRSSREKRSASERIALNNEIGAAKAAPTTGNPTLTWGTREPLKNNVSGSWFIPTLGNGANYNRTIIELPLLNFLYLSCSLYFFLLLPQKHG